jgi:hypothetical protein
MGITLGFRIEADGRTVAYCPDTGYCENALSLAAAPICSSPNALTEVERGVRTGPT